MTKLVYKQIQQLNYKNKTACSYEVTRCLVILFFCLFPGLLDFFENKHYCISNR